MKIFATITILGNSFLAILIISSCHTQPEKTSQEKTIIDSIKLFSTRAEIMFSLPNSEIQVTTNLFNDAFVDTKKGLDSIFDYIGQLQKNDTCDEEGYQDGRIDFYKDSTYFASALFILSGKRQGMYTDYPTWANKYILTEFGRQDLENKQKEIFKKLGIK